jgi:type VI secretion system protein ImpE
MDPSQLYKSGNLAEAIDAQIAVVKAKPTDQGARLFLFELLAFSGDLDRAQKQIDAISHDEVEITAAVAEYRRLLDAERTRHKVFAGTAQPEFLSPPSEAVKQRLFGLLKQSTGDQDAATAAFQEANAGISEIKGTLDGKAFDSMRDGDDRLGNVLEACAKGQYFWIPLENIKTITMTQPRFPRDLIWIPADLEMKHGDAGPVFLPAIYPGTEAETDPQLKLGRLTDWRGDQLVRGVGLKSFFVGADESSILDWRKVVFA